MRLGGALVLTATMGAYRLQAGHPRSSSTVSDFPAPVLQELQGRGCKVPDKRSRGVIIHGEFFRPGQSDWAVLCSTKKSASLLVFPNGSREHVEVLETMPRSYSKWSISVVNEERLKEIKSTLGWRGPVPTEIDHQGIGSYLEFGDKNARCLYCFSAQDTTWYYHQDAWLKPLTMIAN